MSRGTLASIAAMLVILLAGCEREQRRFAEIAPSAGMSRAGSPLPRPQAPAPYQENAWAVSEGQRLYAWFNCQGCHAMGGGGNGPALMDEVWIYGSEPQTIFTTIVEGRPNGMPAYGGRIPDQQVWQLVAYVRTLSALQRKDVRPSRTDSMSARPAPVMTAPARPLVVSPPPAAQP